MIMDPKNDGLRPCLCVPTAALHGAGARGDLVSSYCFQKVKKRMGNGASAATHTEQNLGLEVDKIETVEELQEAWTKLEMMVREDERCVRYCSLLLDVASPGDEDLESWKNRVNVLKETACNFAKVAAGSPTTVDELVQNLVSNKQQINLSNASRDDDDRVGLVFAFQFEAPQGIPVAVLSAPVDAIVELSLKKNSIPEISSEICKLTSLKKLDLSENRLTTLPCLADLNILEHINISENELKELPGSMFAGLVNLTTLIAFKNNLSTLPDEIGQCSSLKELNFFNNKLIRVPKTLADLENLEDLNLGGNKLKTCPSTRKWVKLERLALSWNTIVTLPDFGGMPNLRQLQINRNQIAEIPDDAFDLSEGLEHVDISANILSLLPTSLIHCKSLKVLDATANQIEQVGSFQDLTMLQICKLGDNKIHDIADGNFDKCIEMETLFLPNNALTKLPKALASMKSLARVNLSGNPIKRTDEENETIVKSLSEQCSVKKGRFILD